LASEDASLLDLNSFETHPFEKTNIRDRMKTVGSSRLETILTLSVVTRNSVVQFSNT
jgi:hypothetical protein